MERQRVRAKDARARWSWRRGNQRRRSAIGLLPAVVGGTLASVVVVAGPLGLPAGATTPAIRVCSGLEANGVLTPQDGQINFKIFAPAGSVVHGTTTLRSLGGGPAIVNWPNGIDTIDVEPRTFTWDWNTGSSAGDVTISYSYFSSSFQQPVSILLTATVPGTASGACAAPSPKSTTGQNCAAKGLTAAQAFVADPVNTATGNFTEAFEDFAIAGRGPGLVVLNHTYNSLQAGNDGPLGYGWTTSQSAW